MNYFLDPLYSDIKKNFINKRETWDESGETVMKK